MSQIKWTYKGGKLPADIEEESITNMTCLRIKSAKRAHTGDYNFSLTNEHGSCQHTIQLIVLGTSRVTHTCTLDD